MRIKYRNNKWYRFPTEEFTEHNHEQYILNTICRVCKVIKYQENILGYQVRVVLGYKPIQLRYYINEIDNEHQYSLSEL